MSSGFYEEFQRRQREERERERKKKTESAEMLKNFRGNTKDGEEILRRKKEKELERKKKIESAEMLKNYRGHTKDSEEIIRRMKEKEMDRKKKIESEEMLKNYRGSLTEEDMKLRAVRELERKLKTESAEYLKHYRGAGLNEDELMLTALRQEERKQHQAAEQMLHSYSGVDGIEVKTRERPVRNDQDLPPPVNANRDDANAEEEEVSITRGSVSAMAGKFSHVGSVPLLPGDLASPRKSVAGYGTPLTSPRPADRNATSPSVDQSPKDDSPSQPSISVAAAAAMFSSPAKASAPVDAESPATSVFTTVTEKFSIPSLDQPPVDEETEALPEAETTEPQPTEEPAPAVVSPDTPASAPSDASDTAATPASEVQVAPASPESESDENRVSVAAQAAAIVVSTEGPAAADDSSPVAASTADDLFARQTRTREPGYEEKKHDDDFPEPVDGEGEATSKEVRLDVLFSFGLVTSSSDPKFDNYMVAVEEVVRSTLDVDKSLTDRVCFDPKYTPFVKGWQEDDTYVDRRGRDHVKRLLVTAAVPIFLSGEIPLTEARDGVVNGLQSAIESGRFVSIARARKNKH